MATSRENWKVLLSLLPAGWQQAALESGAVKRLRGFSSPEALLRTLLLHVCLGYSLRETVVRARLADWVNVSDVALLKRMRNSEQWLRFLCIALLRESGALVLEKTVGAVRVVDGTNVKEPGKTGSQWRILYSLQLPSLMCDFLEVTASDGEGNGESLNRLSVARHELILADAGYCSVVGIEYVQQKGRRCAGSRKSSSLRGILAPRQTLHSPKRIAGVIPNGTGRRVASHSAWPDVLV